MEENQHLPLPAGHFLIIFGAIIDIIQLALDLVGIGFIISPMLSFVAWLVFWRTCRHNGVRLASRKRILGGIAALLIELSPLSILIGEGLPGWFFYGLYLTYGSRIKSAAGGTMHGIIAR